MVKRTPKPQMMAVYYAKLTQIYWVADSHLYHAYAWYKLYNLQKSYNKNLAAKDLQLMASSVVLATLAVPPYDRKHGAHHFELEMEKDRNVRMANILGFNLDAKKDSREVVSVRGDALGLSTSNLSVMNDECSFVVFGVSEPISVENFNIHLLLFFSLLPYRSRSLSQVCYELFYTPQILVTQFLTLVVLF